MVTVRSAPAPATLLCLAAALVFGGCRSATSTVDGAVTGVAEGVGSAVAGVVGGVADAVVGGNGTAAGQAQAASVGLRGPRPLRGLRGPRPYGDHLPTPVQGIPQGATAPAGQASYSAATGNASLTTQQGNRYTFTGTDRSFTVGTAAAPGVLIPHGSAGQPVWSTTTGSVTYDPVTRTWTYR